MTALKVDKFLIYLLLIILLLRIPLLFEGLPAVYNSTEYFLAKTALSMGARFSIDPQVYIYPPFFTYLLLIIYLVVYVIGLISGVFQNAHDLAILFLTDPGIFYFSGRLASLILSILTVAYTYVYVNKLQDKNVARWAGLLCGFSFSFFIYSGYATQESLLILLSFCATLAVHRLQQAPNMRNYIIAGMLVGFATGVKYNAALIFLGIVVIYLDNIKNAKGNILWAIFAAGLGFVILNPIILLESDRFLSGVLLVSDQMYSAVSSERGINYVWEIYTLLKTELIVGVVFIAATIWASLRNRKRFLPLLVIIYVAFLFIGSWNKKGLDYFLPIFPSLILISSVFLSHILKRYNSWFRMAAIVFGPLIIVMLHYNLKVLNYDTRELTTEWIVEHVSESQIICYDSNHYDLGIFDIQRYIKYGAGADQLPALLKEKIVSHKQDKRNIAMYPIMVFDSSADSSTQGTYEMEQAKYRRRALSELQAAGVTYLIVRQDFVRMYHDVKETDFNPVIQKRIQAVKQFYKKLFLEYEPIKEFIPDFWHKGPEIYIYRLSEE